jgi:hypothetical protein
MNVETTIKGKENNAPGGSAWEKEMMRDRGHGHQTRETNYRIFTSK